MAATHWSQISNNALLCATLVCLLSPTESMSCRLWSLLHFSELQASRRAAVGQYAAAAMRNVPVMLSHFPRLFAYFIYDWEPPAPSDLMLGQSAEDDERNTHPMFSFYTSVLSHFIIRLTVCLAICLFVVHLFFIVLFAYIHSLYI